MKRLGIEKCEAPKAALIVLGVSAFVLGTYVKSPAMYESLSLTAVLTVLATGLATSLAAIAIVVPQRSIVIHDHQKGHRALIDGIRGGREYLLSRMNSVSLLANLMPFAALFVIVGMLDGGKLLGASALAIAMMFCLSWFCLLMIAMFRLELTVVKALAERTNSPQSA